jgi:hypothetical protein
MSDGMPKPMHSFVGFTAALACLIAATAAYCEPIVVRDATGQSVEIRDNSRIVSIGGAITEIIYALGLEQRLVAIDSTSFYPPQALRDKPNVGYMRALSPEGVLGLNPSLILATEGSGPREAIAVLRAAGVPLVMVPDKYTGKSIIEKIGIVAAAAGSAERGTCLAEAVAADLAALDDIRSHVEQRRKAAFLLSFVNGRAMVAGRARCGAFSALPAPTRMTRPKAISRSMMKDHRRPDFVLAWRDRIRSTPPPYSHIPALHAGGAAAAFVAMNGLTCWLRRAPGLQRAISCNALSHPGGRTASVRAGRARLQACRE